MIIIRVILNLFAGLENYSQTGKRKGNNLEVERGTSVADLLDNLGIPRGKVQLILVNGKHQAADFKLQEGDELSLFPPIGGG